MVRVGLKAVNFFAYFQNPTRVIHIVQKTDRFLDLFGTGKSQLRQTSCFPPVSDYLSGLFFDPSMS